MNTLSHTELVGANLLGRAFSASHRKTCALSEKCTHP